jgi:Fe-Mn family superoxide dismutase
MPPLAPSPSTLSRRDALRLLGGWGAAAVAATAASPALAATGGGATAPAAAGAGTAQPFVLAPLGYAADALEPHFDRLTMEIHHGRHHRAYVDNANRALQSHPSCEC